MLLIHVVTEELKGKIFSVEDTEIYQFPRLLKRKAGSKGCSDRPIIGPLQAACYNLLGPTSANFQFCLVWVMRINRFDISASGIRLT